MHFSSDRKIYASTETRTYSVGIIETIAQIKQIEDTKAYFEALREILFLPSHPTNRTRKAMCQPVRNKPTRIRSRTDFKQNQLKNVQIFEKF